MMGTRVIDDNCKVKKSIVTSDTVRSKPNWAFELSWLEIDYCQSHKTILFYVAVVNGTVQGSNEN